MAIRKMSPVVCRLRRRVCNKCRRVGRIDTLGAPCFHKVFQDARSEKALRTDALRDGSIQAPGIRGIAVVIQW